MRGWHAYFRMVLTGTFSLLIYILCSSFAHAGWTAVSPSELPAVSSDWTLYGVHFTSSSQGWAVGSDFTNKEGVLLHYSGGTWTSVHATVASTDWELFRVHLTSASEGWAVGRDNAHGKGVLLHYNGVSWTAVDPGFSATLWQLNDVHFVSANEGWAVGTNASASLFNRGVLLHYLDGIWSTASNPAVSSNWTITGVDVTPDGVAWAVGADKSLSRDGVLIRYEGGFWSRVELPAAGVRWDLQKVHFTSSNEGWVVGNDNQFPDARGLSFHYVSGTWTLVRPSSSILNWVLSDVNFPSPAEGWAVGIDMPDSVTPTQSGVLAHFSNGSWSFVTPPAVSSDWVLSGVHLPSSSEGWAVGGDNVNGRGVILKYLKLPGIMVSPESADFGSVAAGKVLGKTVTVTNDGDLDLILASIDNPAAPFTRRGGTCRNGKTLIPGASCSITVRFAPLGDGLLTSSFTITSNDPHTPVLTVDLMGRSGPADLTGVWESLTQTSTPVRTGTRYKLTGTLLVENIGFKSVSSSVKFYLSDDASYDAGDTFLKQILTGKVVYVSSRELRFTHTFPVGISASGKYVIAVVDPNNRIVEGDETNNAISSDLITP